MRDTWVPLSVAARRLEVPEGTVRRWAREGQLPIAGHGSWNRMMFEWDDVVALGRRRALGKYGRAERTIFAVGELDGMLLEALAVSGLTVERAERMLPVIADHPTPAPIILASARAASADVGKLFDLGLLEDLHVIARLTVVATDEDLDVVPWAIEQRAVIRHPSDIRRISIWCWAMVEQRLVDAGYEIRAI